MGQSPVAAKLESTGVACMIDDGKFLACRISLIICCTDDMGLNGKSSSQVSLMSGLHPNSVKNKIPVLGLDIDKRPV